MIVVRLLHMKKLFLLFLMVVPLIVMAESITFMNSDATVIDSGPMASENVNQEEHAKCQDAVANELKNNLVGRQVTWTENVTYHMNNARGLVGLLLQSATGLGDVSYTLEYTGVIESVLGDNNVKCIIQSVRILDPALASINYIKNRARAQDDASRTIGQTRAVELSQFKFND